MLDLRLHLGRRMTRFRHKSIQKFVSLQEHESKQIFFGHVCSPSASESEF